MSKAGFLKGLDAPEPRSDHPMLQEVDQIAAAYAASDPAQLFGAVDVVLRRALDHRLCTVNRYEPAADRLVRLYSSDADSYPVGGSKDKAGTSWGRHVLHERRVYVGEGGDAIRQSFDDHARIQALGLQSVINVPIVFRGACLGTLNVLMTAPSVTPAMVQSARLAALWLVPGFLDL